MSGRNEIKSTLRDNPELQRAFLYGAFLFTNARVDPAIFPFCYGWHNETISNYSLFSHPATPYFIFNHTGETFVLVGHAYNPFDGVWDESILLERYAASKSRVDYFNQWTGVFTLISIGRSGVEIWGDGAGMQTAFYGKYKGRTYITSHTYILELLCNLKPDDYVQELVNHRFYPLLGRYLPGDITPYQEFRRLIPNHSVSLTDIIQIKRYFPNSDYAEYDSAEKIASAEKNIAEILHSTLELVCKKWNSPAISLTGGCDSKTTLACANGLYDKFLYFSYDSSEEERVDAEAARSICEALSLPHHLYYISRENSCFSHFDALNKIIECNSGNIGSINANDVRKRSFFYSNPQFDVEIKSWVSECGRAYFHKRFAKRKFPKQPTAHYLTTMYKVLCGNRKLIHKTDDIFENYIHKYLNGNLYGYPWVDLFFWEFRMSSWNGLVITGEHKLSYDIAIPYNNRLLIDMLLRMPLEYRIKDTAYRDIRQLMNPAVDNTGVFVTNLKHTNTRALAERLYLNVMSKISI